jgi:hypothetical protein
MIFNSDAVGMRRRYRRRRGRPRCPAAGPRPCGTFCTLDRFSRFINSHNNSRSPDGVASSIVYARQVDYRSG